MNTEIKYVCSLGSLCQTAEVLKRNNLKMCSYPFDWVFSDADIIIDCLDNNFEKFLDKSNYTEVQHKFNDRTCANKAYHEDFFFHKNPRNEDDYNYYKRCIKRFDDLLNEKENKLFVTLVVPDATGHPKAVHEQLQSDPENVSYNLRIKYLEFNNTFKKYTKNYRLLVVFALVKEHNNYILYQEDNFDFMEIHTVSKSNGLKFLEEKDNIFLDEFIKKQYKFNLHGSQRVA